MYKKLLKLKGTKAVYVKTYNIRDNMEQKMYTDQIGRFLHRSYRENQYIMVLFKVDSNRILVELHTTCHKTDLVRAYQKLVDRLKEEGFEPKLHFLDNTNSEEVEEVIIKNEMKFQYVPPNGHRRNITE